MDRSEVDYIHQRVEVIKSILECKALYSDNAEKLLDDIENHIKNIEEDVHYESK